MPCLVCNNTYTIRPCESKTKYIKGVSNKLDDFPFSEFMFNELQNKCHCVDCLVKVTCDGNKAVFCEPHRQMKDRCILKMTNRWGR